MKKLLPEFIGNVISLSLYKERDKRVRCSTPSPREEGTPAPARIAGGRTACPNWDRRAKQAGGEVKNLLLILLVLTSSLFTSHAQFKDLFDFNNTNGRQPYGDLSISGGQMFGMTEAGATFAGNIFSIDTNGTNFKNLLEFTGANGG
ncbi:MAG: hypothetical protein HKL88_08065, partial [Bacteroidia bacterium]|nr:hypothetical protein [Bacteroidia bacterium]